MLLPPGVSQQNFAAALSEFERIVGPKWIFTKDEDLHLYRDAFSPYWGEKEEMLASAALAPDSVEQVQAIVRVANKYKIPLYPISTGMNLTYGGSAPTYSGSVVVELKRMNRILEVSESGAFCLVEPGVSYYDMYRYLRDKKIKLWIDCADPGWGSLIGNSLDHGVGYTMGDFRDHFSAHCGMEVVLPSGELLRTGMGAVPNSGDTWQQYKYGMGPWIDGIFSQSNFGIVTKMGFWMMPQPQAALQVTVESPKRDDVHAHLDILSRLMYSHVIPSQSGMTSPAMAGPMTPELISLRTRPGGASSADWDRFAQGRGVKSWRSIFTLYGTKKMLAANWEHIRDEFSAIPGVSFEERAAFDFPMTDEQVDKVSDKAPLGVPSLSAFFSRTGPDEPPREGHIDFSPVVPRNGASLIEAGNVIAQILNKHGYPPAGGGCNLYHPRAMIMIHTIVNGKEPVVNRKARDLFTELVDVCAQHGWAEYRVHPYWQKKVMDHYSFNNGALLKFNESLKDAIDPNGILSPGRYGIWPKRIRETRK